MSNRRDPGLEKHWRRVIRACESSGQSIRAYCRGMGLSEASYHFWRREILLRERETTKEESPRFVPVRVLTPAGFQVRVECPSGHLVTLTGGDAEILRGLFGALKGTWFFLDHTRAFRENDIPTFPKKRIPMTRFASLAAFTFACLCALGLSNAQEKKPSEWVSIFDGKSLKGWHVSAKTGHSRPSQNKTGGKWEIVDGAITGTQDIPGNGGIIITNAHYSDFEVSLEMKNDFGPDSGLFLRSTEDGKCYQAMIDYHANGNLMGIYGEGLGGKPHLRNFSFQNLVTDIREDQAPVKLPISPDKWAAFWKHGEWNELKASITGNPPKVTTFIKGVQFMEYTDTEKRLPDHGGIALQVHGGGDFTKQFVRYRNIKVRKLN